MGLTPRPGWNNHFTLMSRDDEAKNDRLFDSRTVERNIRKGLITRKDYDKHLKGLVDVTDKIAPPEALRGPTASPAAADAFDHLDAVLDEQDAVRLPPTGPAAAAGADGDEDLAADDDDIIDDDDDDDDDDDEDEDDEDWDEDEE